MDTLRVLLVLLAAAASECSVKHKCEDYDVESYRLLEGESFYFVPYIFKYIQLLSNEEVTWYKNGSKVEYVSADAKDRVHHHGSALFLLNLVPEDSGVYVARHVAPSGECSNAFLNVTIFKSSYKNNSNMFYGKIQVSDKDQMVSCPQLVKKTCGDLKGIFTWYKDFSLIEDEHQNLLWVHSPTELDEGVYTCMCSWTHDDTVHKTSGSRKLNVKGRVHGSEFISPNKLEPLAKEGRGRVVQFMSPDKQEQFAEEGSELKLNCSVSCEATDKSCYAFWDISDQMVGYNQTSEIVTGPSRNVSTAFLTIAKVSAEDFETEFKCMTSKKSTIVTLKRKGSVVPMVVRGLCVLLFCVFVAVLVRCFVVDLALVFRACFPGSRHNKAFGVIGRSGQGVVTVTAAARKEKFNTNSFVFVTLCFPDMKLYDAYVVYQTENLDKATEDTLGRFVMNTLPSVLEEKCGYRLFIHGRDDNPGEDSLELAEDRMKQSKRLIVILTLGSETQCEVTEKTPAVTHNSKMLGFDWQAGLQQTLVQRDGNVILIQLGDLRPEGHTRLCPNMQRLIQHSGPIRWQEGSKDAAAYNSHFWKRVRYLMPAVPVRRCPPSALV